MSKKGSESDLDTTLVDDHRQSDDGSNHSGTEGSRTIPQSGSNEGSSAEQNETLPVTSEVNNTSVGKGKGAMSETTNSRDTIGSKPGGLSGSYPSTSGGAGQGRLRSSYRGTEDLLGGPNDSSYNMPGQNYPYGGRSGGPYGMSGQKLYIWGHVRRSIWHVQWHAQRYVWWYVRLQVS